MADGSFAPTNLLDRALAYFAPRLGLKRAMARRAFASLTGYESAEPSRKRRFHLNKRSGDALAKRAAEPIRDQARYLDRNSDICHGALDKLTDFMVGPHGIVVDPQPKTRSGEIHQDYAAALAEDWQKWCEWPEVTWTHDWGALCRLAARTWMRDGEALAQLITGPRNDGAYAGDIPVALELLEPDFLPHGYDDITANIRQGIERNAWGRPTAYHVYMLHPGDDWSYTQGMSNPLVFQGITKRVPAANMLHLRLVDRMHQLRGVSVMSSVIARLQDIHEYEESERIAAKMAASMVFSITRGSPEMWGANGGGSFDPNKPPIYQMSDGMIVVNASQGETPELFDTKRPNVNAAPFVNEQLRRSSAGFGLSYSAVARNYDGTYSAQRQEVVENYPHYQAGTMVVVAQLARPTYQAFATWRALTKPVPRDVDPATITAADYMGPPMVQIDPEKEANANLILVQARFKSSGQVIRGLGGNLRRVYTESAHEQQLRESLKLSSTVDVQPQNVSQAKPSAPSKQSGDNGGGEGDGTGTGNNNGNSGSSAKVVPIQSRREAEPA